MLFFKKQKYSSNKLKSLNSREKQKHFVSKIYPILGFKPKNVYIYKLAFIHSSVSVSLEDNRKLNNERLEFLGDTILDAVLSDILYEKYPNLDEGNLTKLRAKVVNRKLLNKVAIQMGINDLLVNNTNRIDIAPNLFGNALEALIGAIFIDKGYSKTKSFVQSQLLDSHISLDTLVNTDTDYKSLVYQFGQKHNIQVGFSHSEKNDPISKKLSFYTTLLFDQEVFGKGYGKTKKDADQNASYDALEKIRNTSFKNPK